MSDQDSSASFFTGIPVRLTEEVKSELNADWDQGIVVAALPTARGLGIHVVNPETGVVTPAFGLEGIVLPPEAIKALQTTHKMQMAALAQVAGMFE